MLALAHSGLNGRERAGFHTARDLIMPIRFSTQAANADHMGPEPDAPAGMPDTVGADGTPRDRADRMQREPRSGAQETPDAGKAGKDINAPGFTKEKDSDKN
ncbi:hypothetical protein EEB15_07620 [Ramlibacter sp. WS9]|nr:hypothetical protein EEB15_07620 [Ramlibacter sp. WS9]